MITEEDIEEYSKLSGNMQIRKLNSIMNNFSKTFKERILEIEKIFGVTKQENLEDVRRVFINATISMSKITEKKQVEQRSNFDVSNFEKPKEELLKKLLSNEDGLDIQLVQEWKKIFLDRKEYIGLIKLWGLDNTNQSADEFVTLYDMLSDEDAVGEYFIDEADKNDQDKLIEVGVFGSGNLLDRLVDKTSGKVIGDSKVLSKILDDGKISFQDLLRKMPSNVQENNRNLIVEKMRDLFQKDSSSVYEIRGIWAVLDDKLQIMLKEEFIRYLTKDNISNYDIGVLWKATGEQLQDETFNQIIEAMNEKDDKKYDNIVSIWANTSENVQQKNKEKFWQIFNEADEKGKLWLNFNELWSGTKNQEEYFEKLYKYAKKNERENEFGTIKLGQLWKGTNEGLQREKFAMILADNEGKTNEIFENTNIDIQREYFNSILAEKGESQEVAELFIGLSKELKEKNIDLFWNLIKTNCELNQELTIKLWASMDESFQDENLMKMFEIIENEPEYMIKVWKEIKGFGEKYKENARYLFDFIKDNDQLVQEAIKETKFFYSSNKGLFQEIMNLFEKDLQKQINCWKAISSYSQEENIEWLNEFCEKNSNNPDIILEILFNSSDKIKNENVDLIKAIIKNEKLSKNAYSKILNDMPQEALTPEFIEELVKQFDAEEASDIIKRYNYISKMNPQLNATINLEMLKNNIAEKFSMDKLVKLSTDPNVQEQIVANYQNANFRKVIQHIVQNSKNWVLEINTVCDNVKQYQELMENIAGENLDDNQIKQLYYCLLENKNWFKVKTAEQLREYSQNKRKICNDILNGENADEKLSDEFKALSESDKKIFAFLELTYGIDIETAQNLVYKYGEDIKEISQGKHGKEAVVDEIRNLKTLLQLSSREVEELYGNNRKDIQKWKEVGYSAGAQIEAEALRLYEELYNEQLKTEEQPMEDLEYQGTKVKVSEITGDFKFFVRVEGAYSYWEEPDDFSTYFDDIDPNANGNCKSLVGNNMFSRARPKGPTFGYNQCKKNSLLISAPWDIVSNSANYSFSPSSVSWNFNKGIQFRIPDKMLDMTRDNHNETVTQKWFWNETTQQIERDKPNFVLYVKPTSETDVTTDPQYEMSIKAAAQLGIPLKVLDMEKNIAREQEKIVQYLKILEGKVENNTNPRMSEEELIQKIIVDLENNGVAMRFADEKLHEKYFTKKMTVNTYLAILAKINSYKDVEPEKYDRLIKCFEKAINDEQGKMYTSTGKITDSVNDRWIFLNCKAKFLDTVDIKRFGFDTTYIIPEMKKIIEEVSKLKYYDGNKAHSIEHIEKVTLFAGMLAEISALSGKSRECLLAAAAFHDSGRAGKDGKDEHAEASAQQVMEYLKKKPENPFGINSDNIGIIQTAIHYHEYGEKVMGQIDEKEIERLCKQYNVADEDVEETQYVCKLLKDADALDRFRFANRATLNTKFLRSVAAKSNGMINFANRVNRGMAERILMKVYGRTKEEIISGEEVSQLRSERIKRTRENGEYTEEHLPVSDLFDLIGLSQNKEQDEEKENSKVDKLLKLYESYGITEEDIKSVTRVFSERVKITNREEQEYEGR